MEALRLGLRNLRSVFASKLLSFLRAGSAAGLARSGLRQSTTDSRSTTFDRLNSVLLESAKALDSLACPPTCCKRQRQRLRVLVCSLKGLTSPTPETPLQDVGPPVRCFFFA